MNDSTADTLPKHFEFATREREIYTAWERSGVFAPENLGSTTKGTFTICMPPPNANGELHIGHCYGFTVMDILGRFHRALGEAVLLLPGKDHAGIQTQVVFEKKLKSEGIDFTKLPVDDLYKRCYDFCIDRSQYMRDQERSLGLTADWSKELFTLDPALTEVIYDTFIRLWNDKLVYRGNRIINWSVFSQTGISDVEVEYKEAKGSLWYICYPLADGPAKSGRTITLKSGKEIAIGSPGIFTATTRPETMLGDTALAVHPEDDRYQQFIGKHVRVPLIGRAIPVIADERVDPKYGTGVIKVTPAHDFLDYEIGQSHKLEAIQVVGKDGKMTPASGPSYQGLKIEDCRKKVVQDLEAAGLLLDIEEIQHKVPIGERGKDIIEPLISDQWFLAVDAPGNSLKQRALELIKSGKINIFPSRFGVLFEQWLENLRDWNISRQLWWGHRMPVWYGPDGQTYVGKSAPQGSGWTQETDTFDTWFSSGQWAFSTLARQGLLDFDAPQKSRYFPSHTMVMGRDILLFWACRMLLLTTYRMGDVPWKNIYFTGLIRDEHGQKMSKSKGNGVEPKEIVAQFGTDALRLGLVIGASPGNDLSIGTKKIEGYSKFINKLWNAAKLIELKLSNQPTVKDLTERDLKFTSPTANWMFAQLEQVRANVTAKLKSYDLSIAADELYNFTWQIYCDWYLEFMKALLDSDDMATRVEVQRATLVSFRALLTMLHPFIPFVTEELYLHIAGRCVPGLQDSPALISRRWPENLGTFSRPTSIDEACQIINSIRSVKAALGIQHKQIRVALSNALGSEEALLVRSVARVEIVGPSAIPEDKQLKKPYQGGVITCEVDERDKYRKRLEQDLETNQKIVATLESKLAGTFATLAKPDVVALERERLTAAKFIVGSIQEELKYFT